MKTYGADRFENHENITPQTSIDALLSKDILSTKMK